MTLPDGRRDLIQIRRDTTADWTSVDPVLAYGELGWDRDLRVLKVGDGSTAWSALPVPQDATAAVLTTDGDILTRSGGVLARISRASLAADAAFTAAYVTVASVSGAGANSAKLGDGSLAGGTRSAAFGDTASAAGVNSIAVGYDAAINSGSTGAVLIGKGGRINDGAGGENVGIGQDVSVTGWRGVAVGALSRATAVSATAIGYLTSADHVHAFAAGRGAFTSADGQAVIGCSSGPWDFFPNNGHTAKYTDRSGADSDRDPAAMPSTIHGVDGVDSRAVPTANIVGGDLVLAAGRPSGSGTGGSLKFQTAPAGASGTTLAALADRLTIDSTGLAAFTGAVTAVGNITARNASVAQISLGNHGPAGQPAVLWGQAGSQSSLYSTGANALRSPGGLTLDSTLIAAGATLSGSSTVTRTTDTSVAYGARITNDTVNRSQLTAQGLWLGPGSSTAVDWSLLRSGTSAAAITGALSISGLLATAATATGNAGLRLPHGTAPSSPVNGDLWTTTAGMFVRIDGVTKTVTLL